jgi:hypothetical protein
VLRSLLPLLLLGPLVVGSAGCGGGASAAADGAPGADGQPGPIADATPRADARTDCPVPTTFVAPSAAGATAVKDASGSITFEVDLDGATTPDRFQLRLISGRGVFIDGVVTGQFPVAGKQLDNASCALCLMVLADVTAGTPAELYFATRGLLRLDAVDTRLTGTITDVDFQHVSLAPDPPHASTPIDDGCTTHISSLPFDVALSGP